MLKGVAQFFLLIGSAAMLIWMISELGNWLRALKAPWPQSFAHAVGARFGKALQIAAGSGLRGGRKSIRAQK